MANTAGGHYGGRPQFPAYVAGTPTAGFYYQQQQQQQPQRPTSYQQHYPSAPPPPRFGSVSIQPSRAPPPPPPGESSVPSSLKSNLNISSATSLSKAESSTFNNTGLPPLEPPPLPPMFPWMSPALAESMTGSQYAQGFRDNMNNLPFVPIIVNDADLAKMTDKVIKEAEQVKSHQLQYYRDVINQDLPQALKDLFQPLYCKLCLLTLSSPVVAKDHYSGKRHKKSVEGWFIKNPHLVTSKQRREGGGGTASVPQVQDDITLVNLPGGGFAVSGPLNGYINKSQKPAASQQSSQKPPSLLNLNFDNNRKRPAPDTQPQTQIQPGIQTNSGQQQKTNLNNQAGPQKADIIVRNSQAQAPPPQLGQPSHNPKTYAGPVAPSSWKGSTASNDFGAKRPRREDEALGEVGPASQAPAAAAAKSGPTRPPQPGGGGNQQKNFSGDRERIGGQGGGGGPPAKSMCEICNVQLSSKVMAQQHFNGKNHKAKLIALQELQAVGGSSTSSNPTAPITPPVVNPGLVSPSGSTGSEKALPSSTGAAGGTNNETNNIYNKLLAISSQKIGHLDGVGPSFVSGRGSGRGGASGADKSFNRGGGRGAGARGGGRGGGDQRGRGQFRGNNGRGRGGPPFRNNNNSSNTNGTFNNSNNRFNNNSRGRGR